MLQSFSPLTSLKVTNFDQLQSVDISQPVTISWENFTEGQGTEAGGKNGGFDGVINVWVECVSGSGWQLVYSSEEITPEGQFGLSPTVTGVTIPPERFGTSIDGTYHAQISFIRIDSATDATNPSGALVAAITGYELELTIRDMNFVPNPWDIYIISPDGWADTQDWMGIINVTHAPWVYSDTLKRYIYIPNEGVSESGSWVYVNK